MVDKSYIEIPGDIKYKMNDFIKEIYSIIEKQYDEEILNPKYYNDILLLISEGFFMIEDKVKFEKIGYDICKAIKYNLENSMVNKDHIGMISGLGYTCFAVRRYNKSTGNLENFSKSLNKVLLEFAISKAKSFMEGNYQTTMTDYDIILGLSGCLYYLLDLPWEDEEKEDLKYLAKYLINLTNDYSYKGNSVMRYHITREKQFRDDEKERFKNGNLNFGLSHGMIGPLIALSKFSKLGYDVEGLDESINKLFSVYEQFKVYIDNIAYWPGQLPLEVYLTGRCSETLGYKISSWCYGNISIARGLQKVAHNMGWPDKEKLYKNDLINILNQPLDKFYLKSPAVCHGYSSILSLRTFSYISDKDKRYIKNIEENMNKILEVFKENNEYINEHKEVLEDKDNNIEGYIEDFSLLQGSLGIALAFLSVLSEHVKYGRLLLID
ncbi:hypothetical protein PV797_08040 [Clostridiaceae bacterium M8S5]|nr:hypothetical protein PV797_08040 [Clostridiaceae bacterium M8S5]